ncbi:MAG: TFIIB-type zinc ribbon-containing protein, partial [Nitrososphaeraceae archaeon]
MIPLYISSIPSNDEYSNLSSDTSDSTDFTCTNCTTTKGQKGKRRNVEPHSYQTTRTITDYESGEIICNTCGMVISDKIQSSETEWHNSEHGGIIIRSGA